MTTSNSKNNNLSNSQVINAYALAEILFPASHIALCGSAAWRALELLDRNVTDLDIIVYAQTDEEFKQFRKILVNLSQAYPSTHVSSCEQSSTHNAFELTNITFDVWIKQPKQLRIMPIKLVSEITKEISIVNILYPQKMFWHKVKMQREKDRKDLSQIMEKTMKKYGNVALITGYATNLGADNDIDQ